MLMRALVALLLLSLHPVTTWATTLCCQADEHCCADEQPSCPVLPDGSCSLAAAGQTVATVSPTPANPSPLLALSLDLGTSDAFVSGSAGAPAPAVDPDPPRLARFQPLRN